MKTLIKVSLAVILCGFVSVASAQEMKVGYVNVGKVFDSSPQVEAAKKKINAEFKSRESELIAKQKRLKELKAKLKKDGDAMSDNERSRLRKDIVSRRRKLNNDKGAFRDDLNLAKSEALNKVRKKVVETIRELARSEKYDLILTDGVVYYSKKVDITDKVLGKLK